MQVEHYFSVASPWVYLSAHRLRDIAKAHGAEVAWLPVQLDRLVQAQGGRMGADLPEARRAYARADLARVAEHLGFPLKAQPLYYPVNAAPASFAVIAAAKSGEAADMSVLVHALSRAVWAEDRDISDDGVIAEALEEAGFSKSLGGWAAMAEAETLSRNTDLAIQKGIFGVPSYLVGETLFWGQDRLDYLDRYLGGLRGA